MLPIDIGGVEARVNVFVVKDSKADLILGRPWERVVRAQFINENDGSLTVRIRSADGRRIINFCASSSNHERNRAFARHPEEDSVGGEWLKL
jgi:hypothetical protein